MGQILIYWHEIDDGAFPDCCMTCGAEDTELVPRKLMTVHWRVVSTLYRYITVELPFCPAHRSRPWIRWGRTDASAFTDEGIWIKNVSEIFLEEMEAFRDAEERYQEMRHRRRHRRYSRDDDWDDRDEGLVRRARRSKPQPQRPTSSPWLALLISGAIIVPVFAVGLCCIGGMTIPFWRFGARPVVQQPAGPAFNPPLPPVGPRDRGPPFGPLRDRKPPFR